MNEVEYDELSEVQDLVSENDARLGYGTFFVTRMSQKEISEPPLPHL